MNEVLLICLRTSLISGILYLSYHVLFNRSTHFHLRRLFLLGAMISSITFSQFDISEISSIQQYRSTSIIESSQGLSQSPPSSDSWPSGFTSNESGIWVMRLYTLGVLIFSVRGLYSFISLYLLFKRGKKGESLGGCQLIYSENISSPASFFNKIFLPDHFISDKDKKIIIEHERLHIHLMHSLDVILTEVFLVFQWYNPFAWFYKRQIHHVHEFEVDNKVLSSNISKQDYQELIFKISQSIPLNHMVNSFGYSTIKNRIIMLNKKRSSAMNRFKYLLFFPLMIVCLLFSSAFLPIAKPARILDAEIAIKGQILHAADQNPIPGATILIKGTQVGTITDVNGQFALAIPENSENLLVISFVNKPSFEVNINTSGILNVSLGESANQHSYSFAETEIDLPPKELNKESSKEVFERLFGQFKNGPQFIVDGKMLKSPKDFPDGVKIKKIQILSKEDAIKQYGESGKKGIIIIQTEKK